ncbi:MAG: NAD(P)/FAD-dependent oxidoreductase [Clostridia bacterium]|nr:NAD(P)/FAD-dependent oxidoreductase [Clostridia bacterium]
MAEYVIIGNGIAATGCIEGIRSVDKEGKITVISGEDHPVYARPLLSYLLENKTDPVRMNYRSPDFYEKNGCDVFYGRTAVSIDPESKTVTLDDGRNICYTDVCVASGSSPFVPPFEGLESVEKKFSFMTLDDALGLQRSVTKDSRVLIVGAGLIGLKCAEGLYGNVSSITVCDLADRVLSSILDSECAGIIQKHLEEKGLIFKLGDSAARFEAGRAYMKSGETVDFDVLVLAVGVRANSSIVKNAGGDVNRGIIINTKMETSLPDVYAAGDCAEGFDMSIGKNRVLAILPNAYMQGHAAGVNMAGGCEVFDNSIPMNSLGLLGIHIMSAGNYTGDMLEEKKDGSLKRFFVSDDRLNGFIIIGDTERAGIYTSLVRERVPLSSIDFKSLTELSSSAVFSAEVRKKRFGEVH